MKGYRTGIHINFPQDTHSEDLKELCRSAPYEEWTILKSLSAWVT